MASVYTDFQLMHSQHDLNDSTPFTFMDGHHLNRFFTNLDRLHAGGKFTDVTLVAGSVKISCHRVVLAAASPYLENCLDTLPPGNQQEFNLQTINENVLRPIVHYLYAGNLTMDVNNMKWLVSASKILMLTQLQQACDQFMSTRVSASNAMGLLQYSKLQELHETAEKAMEYLLSHPWAVLTHASDMEFQALEEKHFVDWIRSDEMVEDDESVVFKLALRWLEADSDRMSCASNVLNHVRFPLLEPEFLLTIVDSSPYMESPKCKELLKMAKNCIENPPLRASLPGSECRERRAPIMIVHGGGEDSYKANTCVWSLSMDGTQCKEISMLPTDQAAYSYNMAACVQGTRLLITGGTKDKFYYSASTNQVWEYELVSNKWRALPAMQQARGAHGMVIYGGGCLVFGGSDGESMLSGTEKLGEGAQAWTSMAPMNQAVRYCTAVRTGDQVYVLDGKYRSTQLYDITQDQWKMKAPMPGSCWWSTSVLVGKHIYVVGGDMGIQCMMYSLQADSWTKLNKPALTHNWPAAVVYKDRVYLTGGTTSTNGEGTTSTIEEFDVNSQTWMKSQITLPAKLCGHCALITSYACK